MNMALRALMASEEARQTALRRQRQQARNDWQGLHWKQQVRLANDRGADVTTASDARTWLAENAGAVHG